MIRMIRFMIHTPVNTRGYLLDYIKNRLPELEESVGDKIALYTPHSPEYTMDCSEEWLAPSIEKGIMPDVIITHATEFASITNRVELFSTLSGAYAEENPVRDELSMLKDPDGIFYPLFVVPVVMCCGKRTVGGLSHSWADLLNEKLKVVLPDRDKPLSRAVGGFMKSRYPEQFDAFEKRAVYNGSPNNVVKSVISGEYQVAVTNASFGMMAKNKGITLNIPSEGVVLLPQVLAFKKDSDDRLKAIADLMMSSDIQDYLGEQGNWPARADSPMGETIQYNEQLLNWQGWDTYVHEVSEFDHALEGESKNG